MVLHKLLEEVLTGETADNTQALQARALELINQMGMVDEASPAKGPCSAEMAAATLRGLNLSEVGALRPKLVAEFPIYAAQTDGLSLTLTAGVADAVAVSDTGLITTVIDWKSDVAPPAAQVELYRQQVREYMAATCASEGLIVFLTSGKIERVVERVVVGIAQSLD